MPTPDNPVVNSQNVTNAIVNAALNNFSDKLDVISDELHQWHKESELRIREIESWKNLADNKITVLQVDVIQAQTTADAAKQQSSWWNGANTLGIAFVAALNLLGIRIK